MFTVFKKPAPCDHNTPAFHFYAPLRLIALTTKIGHKKAGPLQPVSSTIILKIPLYIREYPPCFLL